MEVPKTDLDALIVKAYNERAVDVCRPRGAHILIQRQGQDILLTVEKACAFLRDLLGQPVEKAA
jgi:hypothetical protein